MKNNLAKDTNYRQSWVSSPDLLIPSPGFLSLCHRHYCWDFWPLFFCFSSFLPSCSESHMLGALALLKSFLPPMATMPLNLRTTGPMKGDWVATKRGKRTREIEVAYEGQPLHNWCFQSIVTNMPVGYIGQRRYSIFLDYFKRKCLL